ncbi:T9SS type A sorting domain-containing protein [Formosa sp. 3Alg 14/1]|uniref:T9SS type A sorting domain-containing protein n=1 Tax=Formosa sp. 3Alg 14/1 TaxID=3382190 RepID=UPI0039BEAC53
MKKALLILSILFTSLSISQVQIGSDIDPLNALGQFGKSVSMSSSGNIVAATGGNTTTNKSFVRVFQNNSGVWTQFGSDINDINSEDWFGRSISMSSDGNRIAIGIPLRDINGTDSGAVEVYENLSGTWTQVGSDILGQSEIENLGQSVSLSSDGNILAIGIPEHNEFSNGTKTGRAVIYEYVNGQWSQIGSDIMGENAGDWFGDNINLSSDGSTIAIGTSRNSESQSNSGTGQVEVYRNISGVWTQIGSDINGLVNDYIGESISLSSDGNIVAFGAPSSYGFRGSARVYKNIEGIWTKIGDDILGEYSTDFCGSTLSLSSDGNILAVGSPLNYENGGQSGHVRIFKNISGNWTQIGSDINGEAANDLSAEKNNLSLSADGGIVVIGAWQNEGGFSTYGSGHVRVFDLSEVLSVDSYVLENTNVYPNPTSKVFTVQMDKNIQFKKLSVFNTLGKNILESHQKEVNIENLSKGLYYVKIKSDKGETTKKIVVN